MNVPIKVARWVIGIAVLLAAWGVVSYRQAQDSNPEADPPETPSEREARQVRQGDAAFYRAITNDVVGYQRTIGNPSRFFYDPAVSNWGASATVEFVNRVGGIERTNLNWKFRVSGRDVYCELESERAAAARLENLRR